MHYRLLLWLSLWYATVSIAHSHALPHKRDHANRAYYTIYTSSGDAEAAELVARQLNARFEGRVGELEQYYWISTPHRRKRDDHSSDDTLLAQFHALRNTALRKRDNTAFHRVDFLEQQIPRRRLYKRGVVPRMAKRQDEEPLVPPVTENTFEEQKVNEKMVLSTKTMLNQPGGYEALKAALGIADPGFDNQWHLINRQQQGYDLNVTGVWSQGITGKNVVVAILDDGLDMDSDDLKDNFFALGSYDFNDHTELPKPRLSDDNHGTRCAGEIAAMKNDVCGVGVAYEAKVAGIRILSADITDADEAEALNYKYQDNHIYSCSWGPPDQGEVAEAPQGIVLNAIKNGIEKGRNGTGTIFVFASGNGGANDDNCNFDGYTNSLYTITVGAIDRMNHHPYYAEQCSAQLTVTYSSGSGGYVYTTDVGQNKCADRHGGTSAAAPLAAGVFALVLSVRPDLTWRDMQRLCVETSIPVSRDDDDWALLPSGRMYNHKFGYGRLDAYAIVEAAKTFQSMRPQTHLSITMPQAEKLDIPDLTDLNNGVDKSAALTSTLTVTQEMVDQVGLDHLEHVTATVTIEHGRRGDLEILLESPNHVISQLGAPRKFDLSTDGLKDWTFMSVKHWDENPVGNWTLRIVDGKNPQYTGKFINWTLGLWGEMTVEFHQGQTGNDTSLHDEPDLKASSFEDDKASSSTTTSPLMPTYSAPVSENTAAEILSNANTTVSVWDEIEGSTFDNNSYKNSESKVDNTFFVYTLVVLFLAVSVAGTAYVVRRHVMGPGAATATTQYTSASQQDPDRYEFDVLRQGRRLERVSEEEEDDDSRGEGSGRPSGVTSPMLKRADIKGKGKMVFRSPPQSDSSAYDTDS